MTAQRVLMLLDVLRAAGVEAVLDGGWGVDALLGRETREHEDLDLVVGLAVRFVLRSQTGEQLDFHTVTFDEEGGGLQPQPAGGVLRYPPEGFTRRHVGGCQVACISAEVQVLCHLGYEPSAKDGRDVLALCRRFGLPVPKAYAAFAGERAG